MRAQSPVEPGDARGAIPTLILGYGFVLPPPHLPRFPQLSNAPPAHSDDALLENVRTVLRARGRVAPDALPGLLAGDAHFVTGLEALDPVPRPRAGDAPAMSASEHPSGDDEARSLELRRAIDQARRRLEAARRRRDRALAARARRAAPAFVQILPPAALTAAFALPALVVAVASLGALEIPGASFARVEVTAIACSPSGRSVPWRPAVTTTRRRFRSGTWNGCGR